MLNFLIYVAVFCVAVLLVWWLSFTWTRFYKLCVKIPGPNPYPIFGNVIQIWSNKEFSVENFIKFSCKYFPMCRVFIFNKCFVILHDPEDINRVLKSRQTISKGIVFETIVRRFLGRSVFSEPRKIWKKYRRIMNPTFSTQILKSFLWIFNEKCIILTDILKGKSNGKEFDIYNCLAMMTLDAISQTSLGVNMHVQEDKLTEYVDCFEECKELGQKCITNPIYWNEFIFNCSEIGRRVSKVISTMKNYTLTIIKNKIKYYDENDVIYDENDKKLGFLDYVIRILQENEELLTTEELGAQVNMLAAAGTDTTAFTLSACFMLLGFHKDVQDKVVEELHDIFGDDVTRPAEYEDLRRMSYTEQVLKETMRLFPVLILTTRHAEEDIEIGGYIIPAGTEIAISQFMLHRNPKYFPDPSKFDPERFSPHNCNNCHPHCYIPFFSGPRTCIGHQYAMLQMKTVMCHVLRNFEILPCGTREQMEEVDMLGLAKLKNGYNVRLKVRT